MKHYMIIFTASLAFLIFSPFAKGTSFNDPPLPGDGPGYHNIGIQIAQGKGVSFNWDDPGFRAYYSRHNSSGRYDYVLKCHGSSATSYRPPLYPLVLGASHLIFGYTLRPVYLLQMILTAFVAIIIFRLLNGYGTLPGYIGAGLFVLHPNIHLFSREVLAESLFIFLVTATVWCMVKLSGKKTAPLSLATGMLIGISWLCKSLAIFYVPFLFAAVFLITKKSIRLSLVALSGFMIVSCPWMIRNCLVMEGFFPLGTQGGVALADCYNDYIYQNKGVWVNSDVTGIYKGVAIPLENGRHRETILAETGAAMAKKWIMANPGKLIPLAAMKISSGWTILSGRGAVAGSLFLLASSIGLGLMYFSDRTLFIISSAFILAATAPLAIVCASGDGRYVMGIYPLLCISFSIFASRALTLVRPAGTGHA